uniref:PDZ domain-containing protein n=1 Tax=Cyclopterus lumpus TaxID=8103 RepID=A0A8C2YW52_CYCLU
LVPGGGGGGGGGRYGSLSGKLHMIELEKDPAARGLGIGLSGNKDGSRARMSVHVAHIEPRGPAGLDGRIRVGDELLEINGQILYGRSHQNVSTIINNAPSKVKIILIRARGISQRPPTPHPTSGVSSLILEQRVTVDLSVSRSNSPSSSPSSPPLSRPHSLPVPSTPPSLNTSAAGPSDWLGSAPTTSDPLIGPLVAGGETTIEFCKGNVGLGLSIVGGCDTLLVRADNSQWTSVNGIDLRQATHDEAIGVLRLTTRRVRMCVFRHQEAYREEDLWDVFTLELRPRPGEGLGFATVGKSNDTGIFVSDLIRGGVADSDGRLLLGDQILSINGEDLRAASQEHAHQLLGAVQLEVARFKAGLQYSQQSQVRCLFLLHDGPSKKRWKHGPCDSLDLSVAGGAGSPHDNVPLFIATMDTDGLAAKTHQLQVGNQIIAVNGHCLEGVTHGEAVDILKKTRGSVVLTVCYLVMCLCYMDSHPNHEYISVLTPAEYVK